MVIIFCVPVCVRSSDRESSLRTTEWKSVVKARVERMNPKFFYDLGYSYHFAVQTYTLQTLLSFIEREKFRPYFTKFPRCIYLWSLRINFLFDCKLIGGSTNNPPSKIPRLKHDGSFTPIRSTLSTTSLTVQHILKPWIRVSFHERRT